MTVPKLAIGLVVACVAACAGMAPAGGGAGDWAVVGADRMDVVVLKGDAPLFRLHNVLLGPGWTHGRLLMALGSGQIACLKTE